MVLVRVKVEHLLEDSRTHPQEETCSMEEVAEKEQPLWKDKETTHSIQHTRTNCSREEVCLKKELLLEANCPMTMISQKEEMQKETATCSMTAQTQNVAEFLEVLRVKEECSWMNTPGSCGVSAAAARAGLYAGHAVKDELVVGPECLQPPDAVFTTYRLRAVRHDHPYASERAPVELELSASGMRACCVKLERCDRLLTPRPLTEPSPSTRNNIYECDTCAKTYPYKSNLVRHIQTHLITKVPKSKRRKTTDTIQQKGRGQMKKEKTFSCQKCSKKFARKVHLKHHNLIHTGEKPHVCQTCNKGFGRLDQLQRHERIHTGVKPYSCDVCNRSFSHSGNLTAHQRIHMNLKPYICDICNNRFRESGTLKKHKNTHFPKNIRLRQKRFRCTLCRKSFTHSYTLKIHERIHSGEKPYSCDICMERFSRRDTLLHHVLAHAGEGPAANRTAKKSNDCFS